MEISSNNDFTDYNVAKSFINKSIDTGLHNEKNQELGASIVKIFKNLWHKTEVTFRQICSSFEEGWITNDTIKNRLITEIGKCKDEIDELSRSRTSLGSNEEVDALLAKMQKAQSNMRDKIKNMELICQLFKKRGDQVSAEGVEKQLATLNAKIEEMLDPLNQIVNLKAQITRLEDNEKKLQEAQEKHKKAAEEVESLRRLYPVLVRLRSDLRTAEFQRMELENQLAELAADTEIKHSQREEIEDSLRGLEEMLSQSTQQMKQYVSDDNELKEANVEFTQALEKAQSAEKDYMKLMGDSEVEKRNFLRLTTSTLNILQTDLKISERKLKEKDKSIVDQNKRIADLENQLVEAKKLLQEAHNAEFAGKSLGYPSPVESQQEITQQEFIKVGKEREKGPILEGLVTQRSFIEEAPQVSDEFPRVIDAQLEKLSTAMLNFIGVAKKINLVLNDSHLSTIHSQFIRFEDGALVHAADFFKEIEECLVRLGMAKWSADRTGVKVKKDHLELREAYKMALKAFYEVRGTAYVKDVLPIKQRNTQHMRNQKEKIGTQKFERKFPTKRIEKSISEHPEKRLKKNSPKKKHVDYESRSAAVQFKDSRTTSREYRDFLRNEEKQLKGEVEKALQDLLEAAEDYGMPRGNPLYEGEFPDSLQDLMKFKRKGLKVKKDSLAVAANNIFNKIKVSLEEAGIEKSDDLKISKAFDRVSSMLERLKTR